MHKTGLSFSGSYQDFPGAGAEIIGISSNSEESHRSFSFHQQVPFILLGDKTSELSNHFGVPDDLFGILPCRITYLFNKQVIIEYIFNFQIRIKKHNTEAPGILKELN